MPKKTKWLVILLIIRGIMPFTFYIHDNMIFAHQVKWLKVAMQSCNYHHDVKVIPPIVRYMLCPP